MTSRAEQQEIRRKVKRVLARRDMYQFRQRDSSLTKNGIVGCADCSIQVVARIAKGKRYTLNQIRRLTGETPGQPTDAYHLLLGLRRLRLPYSIRTSNLTAREVIHTIKTKGPVIIAYRYWAHPHWKGARYGGHYMNGWTTNNQGRRVRVGFSRPERKSGANQWGFRLGHAAVLAWARTGDDGRSIIGVRDPNHNSTVRPQRPAWDKIDVKQLNTMLMSIAPANLGRPLVFVPTKRVVW
jgi:hypothetical protein